MQNKNDRTSAFMTALLRAAAGIALSVLLVTTPPALASPFDDAVAAENRGDTEEAIGLYRVVASGDSAYTTTAKEKLVILLAQNQHFDEALDPLNDLITRNPKAVKYKKILAQICQWKGDFYGAQSAWQQVLDLDPGNQEAQLGLAKASESIGSYDAARDFYKNVSVNNPNAGSSRLAATATSRLKRIEGAKQGAPIDNDVTFGRWPASRMPLKVYVEDGGALLASHPGWRNYAYNAVSAWNAAGQGFVSLIITKDKSKADIIFEWEDSLGPALGLTLPISDASAQLKYAKIQIAVNVDATGEPLPAETNFTRPIWDGHERILHYVCIHELGHAIGLGHSPRIEDIMAAGIYGFNAIDVPEERNLQAGDYERLKELYSSDKVAADDGKHRLIQYMVAGKSQTLRSNTPGKKSAANVFATASPAAQFTSRVAGEASPSPDSPARAAMKSAAFSIGCGNYDAGVQTLKKLLSTEPDNAQAHYLMAIALVHLRQFDNAAKHYNAVLKLHPTGKLADLANAGLSKLSHN